MSNPPGLSARRSALRLLDAVLRRGETLDQADHAAMGGIGGGPTAGADRALARAIAGDVLRWLPDLDLLIDSSTRQKLSEDARARTVLRMMLAQWLRLETPPHAVISTCLPLLEGGPRRLAHGVFSALLKREVTLPAAPTLPHDVAARWGERAPAIAAAIAGPPPLDLTLRDPAETDVWAERLSAQSLAPGHLRLPRGTRVTELAGFEEGAWWVQDFAASLPVRLLGAGEGKRVLDLCAAPGGKAMQLAAAGWQVTALDISDKRLERLRESLTRTGLAADIIIADALGWDPDYNFDAILLDAPCSATGTCRRHPDVIHRIDERKVIGMVDLQRRLIERAISWLSPGGRLIYAVCSLEQEEGEEQAAKIELAKIELEADPITAAELPAGLLPTAEGWLRTDPGMLAEHGGLDGFFIARYRRKP